jgi:hypothetical protein
MFRPWGVLDWALGLTSPRQWEFLGCLGAEERSTACLLALARRGVLKGHKLLRVDDPKGEYADITAKYLVKREAECSKAGLQPQIAPKNLLSPIVTLDDVCAEITAPSVVLDITSLPKRFFFYLLKHLFQCAKVKDLVVTYTLPERYPSAPLTEDHEPWDALPSFRQPDPDKEKLAHRRLIVNVGFMPDGLVSHLEGRAEERRIDLIVPFPAPVPAIRRAWQSVWALASTSHEASFTERRVGAQDLSEAFDVIISLLPADTNLVSFAPFGPKPISAAMCLYSILTGSPVYYAQPKVYRPDYSLGIAKSRGEDQILAYWIKHGAQSLFDVPIARKAL